MASVADQQNLQRPDSGAERGRGQARGQDRARDQRRRRTRAPASHAWRLQPPSQQRRGRGRAQQQGRGRGRPRGNHDSPPQQQQQQQLLPCHGTAPATRQSRHQRKQPPTSASRRRNLFAEYMDEKLVQQGLASGELVQGELRVNLKNPKECFVKVTQFSNDVVVLGSLSRNRAYHSDIVALRLKPRDQWRSLLPGPTGGHVPPDICNLEKKLAVANLECRQEDAVDDEKGSGGRDDHLQPVSEVVYIIQRAENVTKDVIGYLRCSDNTQTVPIDGVFLNFVPFSKSMPRATVPRCYWPKQIFSNDPDDLDAVWNAIYSTDYQPWPSFHTLPRCSALELVGNAGHVEPETEALLRATKIGHRVDFPDSVLQSLAEFEAQTVDGNWRLSDQEVASRKDLRSYRIFTIDPTTARDLDDALHIQELPDGTVEIGVHIADVSFFVKEGSAVDKEAQKRCTSVYLVQQVIPMLPPLLSEQLCSLNPGVDRLAFSVIWRMDCNGHVCHHVEPWFGRTIIRSCCKLDYSSAQHMIDGVITSQAELPSHIEFSGNHTIENVIKDCRGLHRIAQKRRQHRFGSGSLRLERPKMAFKFGEGGFSEPVSVGSYDVLDSNRLVEEYMLLANQMVARRLADRIPSMALLRRHDKPAQNVLDRVVSLCTSAGYNIVGDSAASLHRTLQEITNEEVRESISVLLSVAMRRAQYFCIDGLIEPSSWVHYALNFETYTHFTSPIRRYADVLVHRMLASTISQHDEPLPPEKAIKLAERCNVMKARAKDAANMSSLMYLAILLRKSTLVERAVLLDMGVKTCSIYLPRLGLTERVFLSSIECASRAEIVREDDDDSGPGYLELEWKDSSPAQRIGLFGSLKVRLGVTDRVPYKIVLHVLSPQSAKTADQDPDIQAVAANFE